MLKHKFGPFELTYSEVENTLIDNNKKLRRLVGALGILLPILLMSYVYIESGHREVLPSMSHYYYTRASGIFIIVVNTLAIFLIIYKGQHPADFYISILSGIFAICVILFPTTNLTAADGTIEYSVTFIETNGIRQAFHYISTAIFLTGLAVMSIFIFTKSRHKPNERTPRKKIRNRIYRVCGVLMMISMLVMLFGDLLEFIPEDTYDKYKLTFWMETLAVESFGVSWLIKGETLFQDRREE